MALQPTHRLGRRMTYVSPSDGAWNYELINLERDLIEGARTPAPGMVLTCGTIELREGAAEDSTSAADLVIRTPGHEPVPYALPWPTRAAHPFTQYLAGESRFDIDTVRPYLRSDEAATEFLLQRIGSKAWGAVVDAVEAGKLYLARYNAVALSLVSITGLELAELRDKKGVLRLRRPADPPTMPIAEDVIDEIRLAIGEEEWRHLGNACISASTPLTVREKKV